MTIKRIKNFQQVAVLKCKSCKNWQGISTTRTQEQLKDSAEQKKFKLNKAICNYCHKEGPLIDLYILKGICSNQEAKEIIKQKNAEEHPEYSLDFE